MAGNKFRTSIDKSYKLLQRALCKEIGLVGRKRQTNKVIRRCVRMGFKHPICLRIAK